MKHLFLVHSFATYNSALGVIHHDRLESSDCIFVEIGEFALTPVPHGALVGKLNARHHFNVSSFRSILRSRSVVRSADEELNALCRSQQIHLYLPHSYFNADHLLMSHPLCASFSYIEEGLTSYYQPGEIDACYPPVHSCKRAKLANFAFYRNRLPANVGFYFHGYRHAYGFVDQSFPGWPRRITLGLPDNLKPSSNILEKACPVLIFDAIVELGNVSIAPLIKALGRFLKWFSLERPHGRKLRYKFHRGQKSETSIAAIQSMFRDFSHLIAIDELGPECSLETLASSQDCDFYVFNSAAGMYAALAGRKVMSLNPLVVEEDPSYQSKVERLPAIYHTMVTPFCIPRI